MSTRMVTENGSYFDSQKAIGLSASMNDQDDDGWTYEPVCVDEELDAWVIKCYDQDGVFINVF